MGISRNKYLIKNTFIFTLGNLGSKLITFFLVPLYTNALSTYEYGVVDLVTTVGTVAVPILTLNICESVMRFALDKDADNDMITRIGMSILLASLFVGLLIIPICNFFPTIDDYAVLVYLYVISLAASQLFLCDLRGKELLVYYSIGNVLHTFLIAVFNLLFLLVFKQGIQGYLLAYILSNAITALYALVVGKAYRLMRNRILNHALFKSMVRYSVVLIPNSFMWWIMNSSDRIMVSAMVGVAANGIYAISYKLPTLVQTLTSIFNQAWSYSAIREEGAEDEAKYNNRIFNMLTSFVMLIGIGLMTFTKPFLSIYVADEYFGAWKYTPFLIIGFVYLTLGTFMATSYTVHKDSFGYLFSGMFGALFNIMLNFMLIPIIGVYGAAFATCVSYLAVFVFRLFHTRKYIHYDVRNKEFLSGSIILVISGITMYRDDLLGFAIQCVLLIIAFVVLFRNIYPMIKKVKGVVRRN